MSDPLEALKDRTIELEVEVQRLKDELEVSKATRKYEANISKMAVTNERRVVCAYLVDRAGQFEAESGCRTAIEDVAALIRGDEHRKSFLHGELDQLYLREIQLEGK